MLGITLRKRMILLAVAGVCLTSCSHKSSNFERARTEYLQQNYHRAFEEARDLAYKHDRRGEYALGNMYFYGTGTVKDQDLARYWIKQSARHGYQPAVVALSIIEKSHYQQYSPLDNITGSKRLSSVPPRMAQFERNVGHPTVMVKKNTKAVTKSLHLTRFDTKQKTLTPSASAKEKKPSHLAHANYKKQLTTHKVAHKPNHHKISKSGDSTAPIIVSKKSQTPSLRLNARAHTRAHAARVIHHSESTPVVTKKKSVTHRAKKHDVKIARKHFHSHRLAAIPKPIIKTNKVKNLSKAETKKIISNKKIDDQQKDITWALHQNYRNYTVQLSISSKAQKIEKIRQMKIPGCNMVAYRFRDGKKAKYSAVCGSFKKRSDAEFMLSSLPVSLREQAAVYPWGAVQKNMQLY